MGQDIEKTDFTKEDFKEFDRRLRDEADLLEVWFRKGRFSEKPQTAGYELEACLVDENYMPAPRNHVFLKKLNDSLVVPELSLFNIEFNGKPEILDGSALRRLQEGLQKTWDKAQKVAHDMDLKIMMIGILPTLTSEHVVEENMSFADRYKAINEQIFSLRKGKPIELNIRRAEHINSLHTDVMLEAATTSFQIHLKVDCKNGHRYYNASKMVSGPMVGVAANSPYLFGKDLWSETRIPLFEQAVSVGKWDYCERVTFGVRYIEHSLFGVFQANRQRYPVLLPMQFDGPPHEMNHTRLHNGTIWRWTRPIIGFEDDDTPHLRIEHRVIPAGPTIVDQIANMAFFYGLLFKVVDAMPEIVWEITFGEARDNFYKSAEHGLDAIVHWKEEEFVLRDLILEKLLPFSEQGLKEHGIDQRDIDTYLGIIEARTKSGQNGATWQRAFMKNNGNDVQKLCAAYYDNQEGGDPVHKWSI